MIKDNDGKKEQMELIMYDEVLETIGGFGLYQNLLLFL